MRHWSRIRRSMTVLTVAAGTTALAGAASAQTPAPFVPPPALIPAGPADPFFGGLNPGFAINPAFPPNGNGFPGIFSASPFVNTLGTPFESGFPNGFNGFNGLNGFVNPGLLGGTALVSPFTPVGTPFGTLGA